MADLFDPRYQAVDANGLPYSGALLYFYQAGTTTPITTYQNASASTPHASPVVADSSGTFAAIFLNTTDDYKVVLKTAAGVTISTIDNIAPAGAGTVNSIVAGSGISVDSSDPSAPIISAAMPTRYWQGYQHTNSVGTPNTQIDIAAGSARDSTDAINIVNASGTLNLATTGANGLDTGSLANSTWYYTFAITTAAGVTAFLASTSPTAPTLPGGYTKFRRIGSFKTNGSAQVLAFTHVNDLWFWETSPRDVNTSAQGTSLIAYALSVPRVLGIEARGSVTFFAASTISPKMIPGFMGANAVNGGALSVGNVNGGSLLFNMPVDASAQVKIISSAASTTIVIDTSGWRDVL